MQRFIFLMASRHQVILIQLLLMFFIVGGSPLFVFQSVSASCEFTFSVPSHVVAVTESVYPLRKEQKMSQSETTVLVAGPAAFEVRLDEFTHLIEFGVVGDTSEIAQQLEPLVAKDSPWFALWMGDLPSPLKRDAISKDFPSAKLWPKIEDAPLLQAQNGSVSNAHLYLGLPGAPRELLHEAKQADCTIVIPHHPVSEADTRAILEAAQRSVLIQPLAQFREFSPLAIQRMRRATLTILTEKECWSLTGEDDPVAAIQRLREQAISNLLIMFPQGVIGFADHNWIWQPSYLPLDTSTGQVGNVIAAVIASGLARQWPLTDILPLALTAAARNLEGVPPASWDDLEVESHKLPLIKFKAFNTPHLPTFDRVRPYLMASALTTIAAGTFAAFLLGYHGR